MRDLAAAIMFISAPWIFSKTIGALRGDASPTTNDANILDASAWVLWYKCLPPSTVRAYIPTLHLYKKRPSDRGELAEAVSACTWDRVSDPVSRVAQNIGLVAWLRPALGRRKNDHFIFRFFARMPFSALLWIGSG